MILGTCRKSLGNTYVATKKSDKYKFILKGGTSLLNALFRLYSLVWNREEIPKDWLNSELVQLPKGGKPSNGDMDNMRFIHLKEDVPKVFQQIVMESAKDKLIEHMTKFQIATKPGHRASEHVYCLVSLMALSEKMNKGIFITMFDLRKFFDTESLVDCQFEMYKSSVNGKLYKLLYLMNQNIRIRVRTPVGITDAADTGPGMGQGTIPGAIISATSLDQGVKEYFHEEEEEIDKRNEAEEVRTKKEKVKYGDIVLKPLLFQDDIADTAESVESAQLAMKKVEHLLESKLLDINELKSCFLIVGNKKAREKLQKKVDDVPLMLAGTKLRQATAEKYLGFRISATVDDSVASTVSSRLGAAYQAIYQARSVVQDSRSSAVGQLSLIFDIFELSIVPALLYGSEAWYTVPKKTMNQLEKFSNCFLKLALGLPKTGSMIPSMYFETGTLLMSHRILMSKLLFFHHLANLPSESLASEFFALQSNSQTNFPSIVTECNEMIEKWNLGDVSSYSKYRWKKVIRVKIFEMTESSLIESMKRYKKIDYLKCKEEGFSLKPYFKSMNISDSRMFYRVKYFLVPTIRLNYKQDKRYTAEKWLCPDCKSSQKKPSSSKEKNHYQHYPYHHDVVDDDDDYRDSQYHVQFKCVMNNSLRQAYKFDDDEQVAKFFHDIVSRRRNQNHD